MAQLDFYFNKNEKRNLLDFFFKNDFKLIPDNHYLTENYLILNSLHDAEPFLEKNVVFHLIHDSFSKNNLLLRKIEKQGKEIYYILPKYGGPTLDSYLNGIAETKGIYSTNFIAYYSKYFINDVELPASQELKTMFKLLSNYIKKNSKSYKFLNKTVWIGNDNDQEIVASKLFK
jgi:hypothetical protein